MACADALVGALQIFLYVGTFIGERLLYMPSLGFCLLLAEPLSLACASRASAPRPGASSVARGAAWLSVTALLGAYGARTWMRNYDWFSEEALFRAALRVCPDSAKVRLNNGILARRDSDWELALEHFRRARRIEPGYCEPIYWIGITKARACLFSALPLCTTHECEDNKNISSAGTGEPESY